MMRQVTGDSTDYQPTFTRAKPNYVTDLDITSSRSRSNHIFKARPKAISCIFKRKIYVAGSGIFIRIT